MKEHIQEIKEIVLKHDCKRIFPKFIKHALEVPGFSGAATLDLLNRCVSKIPDDMYYLEIGTHQGKTITGAALDNKKHLVGVDNFSMDFGLTVETIKWSLYHNLAKYTRVSDVTIYPMGYLSFIEAMTDFYRKKIAVYFYDGSHDMPDQRDNLWQIKPMLDDHAIVLIDDTFSPTHKTDAARQETEKILREDSEYTLVRDFQKEVSTPSSNMEYWNGLMVLEFVRKNEVF